MDFVPEWLTFEIQAALGAIEPPHLRKKRNTVLRLAQASALAQPMSGVFEREDCCSETTWRGKYRVGEKRPGWADDEKIQAALKLATERAQHWEDTRITRGIAKAQERLADEADNSVKRLVMLRDGAKSENLQRQASLDILDRAGTGEVANKATPPCPVVRFELDGLPTDVLRSLADDGEPDEIETGGEA